MEKQLAHWSHVWKSALPALALVGPTLWLIAAMVRAMGIGTLPDDLSWVSGPEGVIMSVGAPFFVATFIFMGQTIASRSPKTGVLVTVLGILGTTPLSFISGFRPMAKGFVDSGLDPAAVNTAFESEVTAIWLTPLLLYNLGQFVAWIFAGVAVVRTKTAPWWAGLALVLGVPCLITAQAFYIHLELFWPLANALWLLGVWGLVKFGNK